MGAKHGLDAPEQSGCNSNKKRRSNVNFKPSVKTSSVDQTYGQQTAFGSLDAATFPDDDDLDFEDDTDALAYLKTVRQEASAIPHVVAAQKAGPELPPNLKIGNDGADEKHVDRSIYQTGRGDFRAYYHDGAYIARAPGYAGDDDEDEDEDEDVEDREEGEFDDDDEASFDSAVGGRPFNSSVAEIHEAYYSSLRNRYLALREILHRRPPDSAIASLPKTNPTEVGYFNAKNKSFQQWAGRIRGTDPQPAQIAAMHKDGVILLLRVILNDKFLRKNHELRERTSRWLWALLARLPDKGELDYQEIGWLRELGKRAVLFMVSLVEAQVLREDYGVRSGGSEEGEEADVDEGVDEVIGEDAEQEDDTVVTESHDPPPQAYSEAPASPETKATEAEDKTAAAAADAGDESDVEMQLESDLDEGEISEDAPSIPRATEASSADVESAKARLLAQLDDVGSDDGARGPAEVPREEANLRATLNMVLTVAGEFYGQRDLLEFRDPFGKIIG